MTPPLGDPFAPTEPEWLMMAKLGIKTKTELPQIIPPLPKGDTTDMKLWREYWKQHDTAIRKAERERVLDEFMAAIEFRFDDTNQGRGVVGTIRGIRESLRSEP